MKANHQNTLEPLSVKVSKGNVVDSNSEVYDLSNICVHTDDCQIFQFLGECPYLCDDFEANEPYLEKFKYLKLYSFDYAI